VKLATNKEGKLRQFFTQQQFAAALQLHVDTVRARIERGEITAVLVGRQLRIPGEEIERYLQRARIGRPFRAETHPRDEKEETI
jgi:excisionase family DNA binding protein